MQEIKELIAKKIAVALENKITEEEVIEKIEVPKEKENGDFAYPCFSLAKIFHQSPLMIANQIKENMNLDETFEKVEVVKGYLNFYLEREGIVASVLQNILEQGECYGTSHIGEGKNIIVEYSSPNIAKPFHLGHFRNTVLGNTLYQLYQELGYHVIGINHLGDWGRQFGLLIEGYQRFGNEYDMEKDPLNALSDIYVRINKLAKEEDHVMEIAREHFKKLEEGDPKLQKMWQFFRAVSLKEYQRIYEILGCHFDSYNGEAFYSDKMDEVVEILEKKNVLVDSQGAKVVNVGENVPPCIILKSNGSTIYATRDLAAILYRARTYDFTKCIYITATEQILHFKQIFEVAKYLVDEKYQKGLTHIAYGMIRLKTGKMSTREGTVIYINDLIQEAIEKSKKIMEEKNTKLENLDLVAKQIGVGALTFHYLKTTKVKDIIFDLDETLRFDGETGPYVQYTYVRTKSVLEKAKLDLDNLKVDQIDFSKLKEKQEVELVKALNQFPQTIQKAAEDYEPAVLARYLIEIATLFSRFYNECTIMVEEESLKIARCSLVYATSIVLKKGLGLLGIEAPDKM